MYDHHSSTARRRTVYGRQGGYRPAESQPTHLAGVSYRAQDTLYRVRRQSPLSGIRHREDARGKLPQGNPLKTRKRAGVEACPFPCLSGSIQKPVLISNDNRRCRTSGCGGCLYQPLSENRRRVSIQPEREGYDDLHVIYVRPIAAVQTDTRADLVVVQGVFFEDGFDSRTYRSGSRTE